MLFTRNLITKFIPDFVNISDEKLIQSVNSLGMEVESVTKHPHIDNIVIGELLSAKPIEGTHLSLCNVKIAENTTNQIICGASGLKVGKKVLVALEGAKLPNGITIAKRMIHGYESNGMMCAYSELSGSDAFVADAEKDEIIMLDQGEVGSNQWEKLIGFDDTIYDVTVPANRNDENAYLVFCYELANKLGLHLRTNLEDLVNIVPDTQPSIAIDTEICNFLAFMDYNINIKYLFRSDWAIKSVLMNHGIKPINQLLDRLALITMMTNCPTHVYDAEKLHGSMSCRLAGQELKFVALNSKTYTLNKNDILICDDTQPVSIAAVIGSDNTKIGPNTSKIKIEVGNFDFAKVRTTAIRLNCETDASKKASKVLSNYLNLVTVQLIKKYLGSPAYYMIWAKKNWFNSYITLDYKTLAWFINEPLDKKFVVNALERLGYRNSFFFPRRFKPAKWRLDVSTQEDMFEDILKIIDVNKLQPISIEDKLLPIANNTEYELKQALKDVLINNCFNEVKTYNLTNKANLNKFNLFNTKDPIKILCNNVNREYFRLNMLDNMLKVYKYNDARKLDLIPIFEIQKLFTNTSDSVNLSCLSLDKYVIDNITKSTIAINLNYFKDLVKQIAKVFNTSISFKPIEVSQFYNNESLAIIWQNKIIGYMGKIKASALKDYDLNNKAIYALSLNINQLFANYKPTDFKVKSFGVFQRLSKDVNIILDAQNAHLVNQKIEQIKSIKDIADAQVINIFNKDGKTIYTVRYYLVDTRQFTNNDLEQITKKIESLSSL